MNPTLTPSTESAAPSSAASQTFEPNFRDEAAALRARVAELEEKNLVIERERDVALRTVPTATDTLENDLLSIPKGVSKEGILRRRKALMAAGEPPDLALRFAIDAETQQFHRDNLTSAVEAAKAASEALV